MLTKDQMNLIDRREMLKVKIKALMHEARVIRLEEQRSLHRKPREFRGRTVWAGTPNPLHLELWKHRTSVVRSAARETHLAYGFIRGKTLDQMEPTRKTEPDWDAVRKMLKKYGRDGMLEPEVMKKAA